MTLVVLCGLAFTVEALAREVRTDRVASSRMVVDFEPGSAIQVIPSALKGGVVAAGSGHVLEIESHARGGYPRAEIRPASGRWDLGEYDVVLMDVENLDNAPVRVLLSLKNPGSDGRRRCNTEAVTVPAKSRGVVRVPYAVWHGRSGHMIDRGNITGISVLLDKPSRYHHFTVDNIRAVTYQRIKMSDLHKSAFYRDLKPFFGRGVNLGNALEAPREGSWGVTLQRDYFTVIRKAGFDSVRIPVRWSAHAEMEPPYRIEPAFFERVDWAVDSALEEGLNVALNMHHYDEFFENVEGHDARFVGMWRQIAERYRGYPANVCFELLNEPHDKLTAVEWNRVLADTLKEVRNSNPDRWIMVGPAGYNQISLLDELKLPATDRRIVVTVHYYSPFRFTHQGAGWTSDWVKQLKGIRWLGSDAEQDAVRRDLDVAMLWGAKHKRPIYLGEFGAYSPAAMEDRARWTEFVAREAMAHKMGYAYWEFCAGFGAYDPRGNAWIKPLLNALIW